MLEMNRVKFYKEIYAGIKIISTEDVKQSANQLNQIKPYSYQTNKMCRQNGKNVESQRCFYTDFLIRVLRNK